MKKAVVGGRVKQPQIIIQGMPAVSTTAIPQGYPTLTVTSDADLKPKAKAVETGTQARPPVATTGTQVRPPVATTGTQARLPVATTGTQVRPPVATTEIQTRPPVATTEIQTEAPTRMTTAAQTNLIEHVGVGTQTSMKVRSPEEIAKIAREQKQFGIMAGYKQGRAREAALRTKETKEMGTETEPLLVNVAKGAKQDIFALMKEQEVTGKVLSLTGAGRPSRQFSESVFLANPPPAPAAPAAPAASVVAPSSVAAALRAFGFGRLTPSMPRINNASASSSMGVPGYTVATPEQSIIQRRSAPSLRPPAAASSSFQEEVIDLS
jgi:hypothetical protein